ncbi:MAG: site-specific DNA-methyltransferase [Anaerolineae bacterium]|nr:site-specific DNA-methyltransferase [Anaerolineae bacterium]
MTTLANLSDHQLEQLKLFEPEGSVTPDNGDSYFSDPSFANNKTRPIHRWVPWIAGFSSSFVRDVLQMYLESQGTVLDPFCGVGTALVEALLCGHNAIGFEINPYAAQASRTKVNAHLITVSELECEISRFQAFYKSKTSDGYVPKSTPPEGFRTRSEFYSPRVLHKVLILQDFIDTITDSNLREIFRLAFASTMVRYSNYSYEPSLGRRVSAGKQEILDFPVGQAIVNKLLEMLVDTSWFQENLRAEPPSAQVINDSFFNHQKYLPPASVDLIVTSPPYLNNYHYNRNTRPQLYWLGYAEHPKDMKPLEQSNFGKYWQTVRERDRLDLEFSLPSADLEEQLQTLRQLKPEKGIYGGNGWANYAAAYFNDCYTFAKSIKRTLKPNATALVVIGNSILQGVMIPTDQYFGKISESIGLELVRIDVPRATRVGNSIIQSDIRVVKAKKSHQLYEAIVELRNTDIT